MVTAFTERDILDSIELRGTLEGLAARFAAERGARARSLEPLKECLADLDQLVRQDQVSEEAFSAYVTMNARFHALLNELSGSAPLLREIDRVEATTDVTPDIREIKLRPDGGQVAPYPVGSHIGVAVLVDGQPQRRSYSLVGDRDPGRYRIAVRLAPDSRGGSRGMWNLKPGAR